MFAAERKAIEAEPVEFPLQAQLSLDDALRLGDISRLGGALRPRDRPIAAKPHQKRHGRRAHGFGPRRLRRGLRSRSRE